MPSREVDARGDGLQQSTTMKADTMRASDKMDSCNIRAALQILQTNTRAPPNIQTAAEVHSLAAVETDEQETVRIKMQCAAIKQAAKLVKRMARGVVLAAEPGWRNADIAVSSRSEGRPAVLRECVGRHLDSGNGPTLDCGPKKPEPGQQMPQPCPRKLRPIALAEVLMKLAKGCVIEQHLDRLLKRAEPTNLGLGTPDAAALVVRTVRGWANDMAAAPTQGQDADVVLPIGPENACGRAFR